MNSQADERQKGGITAEFKPLAVAPAEAARIAGVGRTSLYSAISSGELKSFRFGRRRLIRTTEIEAWLKLLEAADDAR